MRTILILLALIATGCAETPVCQDRGLVYCGERLVPHDGRFERDGAEYVVDAWCGESWAYCCGPGWTACDAPAPATRDNGGAACIAPEGRIPDGEPARCGDVPGYCVEIPCDGQWHYGADHPDAP